MAMAVETNEGVTLVGGAGCTAQDLSVALTLAPVLVAADGGANTVCAMGHLPEYVIGDMDSLDPGLKPQLSERIIRVAEQDSTDFDKCLSRVKAPFLIGLGFDGARLDHTLAAMTSLVRHGRARVVLLCAQDICFLAPPQIRLDLSEGERLSLFPMAAVTGRSTGLYWPIDGLEFAPDSTIGTSNRAASAEVKLAFDTPGMLVFLERAQLQQAVTRLVAGPDWPQRA